MKKRIVTQEIKRWNRRDRLFSLVFWATAFLFIVSLCGTFGSVRAIDDAPGFLLSIFVFYVVVALAVTLPLYILGKAVIRRFRRRAMEATTFESVQEMTYYRDRLEGLTPTLISYLIDLKLEPKKDITALILQYQLWGILVPTETHYAYPDITDPRLQRRDRSLLAWIYRNQEGAVTAWERQSRQEAIASG